MSRVAFPFVFLAVFPLAMGSAAGDEAAVLISRGACDALVAHQPDVSVAYQPGVDVNGGSVAPADLPGHTPLTIDAEDVSIELRLPLSAFYDAPASLQPLIGNAEIDPGRVTVRDGVAYLGAHRLTDPTQNAIARACADQF